MIIKQKYFLLIVIISALLLTSCCRCGRTADGNIVKGMIVIVGNEPFTKVALKLEDEKVYLLQCDKKLDEELRSKQGKHFAIKYKESKSEDGLPILIVEEAEEYNYFESK